MAEFVNLIKYLKGRITLLIGVFIFGLALGYPLSGDAISWLLQANGYLPEGVELIIIQPMEVILLRLRIATQIGIALVFTMIIVDLSWNGSKIISKSNKNKIKNNTSKITNLFLVSLSSIGLGIIGPGAEPEHIEPRLEPHSRAAITAVAVMLGGEHS